jgi:hypothetical protein
MGPRVNGPARNSARAAVVNGGPRFDICDPAKSAGCRCRV